MYLLFTVSIQASLYQNIQQLVCLISPLLSYGFWTSLVSTESNFQGKSNAIE